MAHGEDVYGVDFEKKKNSYGCNVWDLDHVPCSHVIAAAKYFGRDLLLGVSIGRVRAKPGPTRKTQSSKRDNLLDRTDPYCISFRVQIMPGSVQGRVWLARVDEP